MSVKTVRPKRSPRAMPMETIITRFKSAQQKQKQDNKQTNNISKSVQSIKHNPKSKTNLRKIVSKCVQKIEKSRRKEDEVKSEEFYPDKKKRGMFNKKILLAPKHCLKVIGGTKSSNKRKLYVPQKDTQYCTNRKRHYSTSSTGSLDSKYLKDNSTESNIRDMILLIEDEGSLDDEDLLEILTCPSPVWWEDPPDGYVEESIFSREKSVERISVKNQLLEEEKKEAERKRDINVDNGANLDVSKFNISINNRDESFINKRCKLESLLGGIRNKINDRVNTVTTMGRNKIRIKTPEDINGQSFEHNTIKSSLKSDTKAFEGTRKKYLGSFNDHTFLDFSDEEIYRLENIEIPIAPVDDSPKSYGSLLDINQNDTRNQRLVKDMSICKTLTGENDKNSSILSDRICIDLSSDNSNDACINDDIIEIQKSSVRKNTVSSTSNNRKLEDTDVQKSFNGLLNQYSTECYEDSNISKDRSRRNSINSYESDKNMSEEYLDMSIFEDDDDDEKADQINEIIDSDLESHTDNNYEQSPKFRKTSNIIAINKLQSEINNQKSIIPKEKNKSDSNIFSVDNIGKSSINCTEQKQNDLTSSEISITQTIDEDKNEYVEVYKIICNDSDNDDDLANMEELNTRTDENHIVIEKTENFKSTDKVNRKLDSYYKQRKPRKKYNKKSVAKNVCTDKKGCISCNYKNKSIIISESETIKYCLRCSSIFDTEECKYCIGKSNKRCSCKDDSGKYVCDICDLKLYSKHDMIMHLNKHSNNLTSAWDHIYS